MLLMHQKYKKIILVTLVKDILVIKIELIYNKLMLSKTIWYFQSFVIISEIMI